MGNGVATAFPFTFKVFDASDVAVYYTDSAGTQSLLTTNYTVALNADQDATPGGTVTYPTAGAALSALEQLALVGDLDYVQGTDITNAGRFLAQVIENVFDYLTILAQQLLEKLGRALSYPVGDSGSTTLPSATVRAGNFLAFDALGNPIAAAGTTATPVSAFMATVLDDTTAGAARTTLGIGNVDNTSDVNKPVSTAQQAALDLKANLSLLQGVRNRIINGNFAVNQRAVASGVVLAAGAYGHDRWKAGAAGCTYTYAASGNGTLITITAGSLMQVIEDKNVEGGVYALQNAGTAQARIAVSGAATAGAYAAATSAAPLASANATGNQTISVEFTLGTVSKVQLEPGAAATAFERRPYGAELALCQRYFWRWAAPRANGVLAIGQVNSATLGAFVIPAGAPMRSAPTLAFSGNLTMNDIGVAPAVTSVLGVDFNTVGGSVFVFLTTSGGGMTAARACILGDGGANTAALTLSAELRSCIRSQTPPAWFA